VCQYLKSKNDSNKRINCRECQIDDGYMKKLVLSSKEEEEFIHPICAMSYPNIYQMGGPANMSIKFCKDVDREEIDKTSDPN